MPLTEAPIIVPSKEDIKNTKFKYCEGCKFEYNYILGNLTVIKQSNYLEIKTGTEDQPYEVKSDLLGENEESKGKIHKIRLFKPSLNSYENIIDDVEAELIIEHRSVKGNGSLSVCIPIISQSGENENEDSKWLSTIINRVDGMRTNNEQKINGSFTLNKLIPRSEYIVLEKMTGTWMDNKNSNNNNIIIMTTRGLTVNDTDITKLNISTSSPNPCSMNSLQNCWRFSEGKPLNVDDSRITKSTRPIGEPGINHKPTMTCYPIDTDGKIIKKGYLSMEKTQVPLKDTPNEETVQTLQIVVGILGGLLVLVLAVVLGPKIKHAIAIKLGLGKTAKAAAAARVGGPLKK